MLKCDFNKAAAYLLHIKNFAYWSIFTACYKFAAYL